MINKKSNLLPLLLLSVFILGFAFVFDAHSIFAARSLETMYPGKDAPVTVATPLADYIKYIFNFSILIAGLVAFGALVAGGFQYLTSAGSPTKIEEAKSRIVSAFLGLIIILSSYLILVTINPQLAKINIAKRDIAMPTIEPVKIPTTTNEVVLFQIPMGKIIERAISGTAPVEAFAPSIETAKLLEEKSKTLKNLAGELKDLTNACQCNQSSCSGIDSKSGAGCSPLGCPSAFCDIASIQKKINEMKTAIADLETTRKNVTPPHKIIFNNLSELQRAGILTSLLSEEIEDYNTMLVDKYFIEQGGATVKFDYFPGWDNIKITFGGATINDPATFYFNKDNNENALNIAKEFDVITAAPDSVISRFTLPSDLKTSDGVLDFAKANAVYYQNDPRWANNLIGGIDKMGRWGCNLTSFAMILKYLGFDVTPEDVRQFVTDRGLWGNGGTSNRGLLFPKYQEYLGDQFGWKTISAGDIASEINQNHPVFTGCTSFYGVGSHFIVITGIKGDDIYIQDPQSGWANKHKGVLSKSTFESFGCGWYYVSFWRK